jgi:hypothetical protein
LPSAFYDSHWRVLFSRHTIDCFSHRRARVMRPGVHLLDLGLVTGKLLAETHLVELSIARSWLPQPRAQVGALFQSTLHESGAEGEGYNLALASILC